MSTTDITGNKNRNIRVTSSPVTPLTPTGRPWLWVQAEGAGTVTLTDESGTQTAFPLYDREPLMGPWSSLVSFTGCTAVRLGDGKVPSGALSTPTSTTVSLGSVKLSVAPLVAASPIAAGSNDPRLLTIEASMPLSATDGSLAEQTAWTAPVACTVVSAFIETGSAAMSASNSNWLAFNLANRPLAGPATSAAVASANTKAASLNGTTAWTEASLGTITNASMLVGDRLTFASVKTGSGQAGATGILRVVISVP
jgi:hypothetical protein